MATPKVSTLRSRVANAWNAFISRDDDFEAYWDFGHSSSFPYHRTTLSTGNEQSVINAVMNRCAIDVSQLSIKHVRLDHNGHFVDEIDSGLNRCLTLSANIDQSGRAFLRDVVISMLDEGAIAIVPVDTTVSIEDSMSFDVLSLRVGRIVEWFPLHVRVELYNDRSGMKEEIILPKDRVGIIENPLYSVMNEPNSTLKRLVNKLNLLDAIDEQSGSGRLDVIIQLPYVIKSEQRRKLAEERLAALEAQLKDSKHGVAYADGTEKIIQLNRPAENNLMTQIEYLTSMLYSQLGMSDAIFSGTASPEEFLNYYNRTVEPIAAEIAQELKRKFLTPTAITQGHSISHYRNPLGFITAAELAELSDKLTRNEILSSNEVRAIIGFRPSEDPGADELRNKNLSVPSDLQKPEEKPSDEEEEDKEVQTKKENNQNGRKP